MKISTRGRYALRLMLDLAQHSGEHYVSLGAVSTRQGISIKYLEQIITLLTRADFVRSARGPRGGYQLTRPASEYTPGMIFRLTEGSLAPVACMDDVNNTCERRERCTPLWLYRKLDTAIRDVVDSITLQDLLDKERSGSFLT